MGSNSKDQRELAMYHPHPFFLIKDKYRPSRKKRQQFKEALSLIASNLYRDGSFSHCFVV